MSFNLTIDTGNDAFADPSDCRLEIDRLLRKTAAHVLDGRTEGTVSDYNGATVGSWNLQHAD